MILKMRICLYSATPWDSENLPCSQPRHLRQRTLIQPLCRLGNGFLPVTDDRFRGFKAKRTNRKRICWPIRAKELEIQPIRAFLPASKKNESENIRKRTRKTPRNPWISTPVTTVPRSNDVTLTRHLPADTRDRTWNFPYNESNGSGGVIVCKGLEIQPIRGEYMLTNQRRVYVDQSERRSSRFNQSEPSSRQATRGTPDCIKGTVPSFLPFPSMTQYQHHVNLGRNLGERERQHSVELSKNASKRTCLGLKSLVADWLRETWRHEFLPMKQRVFKNSLLIGWNETNSLAYFLIWA